jgi:hypothetical protein
MIRYLIAALALGLAACGAAAAAQPETQVGADPSPPTRMGQQKGKTVYVQLIVKACHQVETPLQPINQGKSYDDEPPLSLEQRKAALVTLGCIDVPVPMDFLAEGMSPTACMGHAGYLASMQFLEQRQDLSAFPAVGAWECVITDHEIVGPESM